MTEEAARGLILDGKELLTRIIKVKVKGFLMRNNLYK